MKPYRHLFTLTAILILIGVLASGISHARADTSRVRITAIVEHPALDAVSRERRGEFQDKITRLGLGLDNRLGDRMGLLSGGHRQAVSLVMATLNPTKMLLLDEHTAALDPKTAAYVMELTERIVSEGGLTTMMVTHSMRQALDHGERTLMLHEGSVVLDVAGEERKGLQVEDLLHMFEQVNGRQLGDDKLLLG